jgi:hypothetical protein
MFFPQPAGEPIRNWFFRTTTVGGQKVSNMAMKLVIKSINRSPKLEEIDTLPSQMLG